MERMVVIHCVMERLIAVSSQDIHFNAALKNPDFVRILIKMTHSARGMEVHVRESTCFSCVWELEAAVNLHTVELKSLWLLHLGSLINRLHHCHSACMPCFSPLSPPPRPLPPPAPPPPSSLQAVKHPVAMVSYAAAAAIRSTVKYCAADIMALDSMPAASARPAANTVSSFLMQAFPSTAVRTGLRPTCAEC